MRILFFFYSVILISSRPVKHQFLRPDYFISGGAEHPTSVSKQLYEEKHSIIHKQDLNIFISNYTFNIKPVNSIKSLTLFFSFFFFKFSYSFLLTGRKFIGLGNTYLEKKPERRALFSSSFFFLPSLQNKIILGFMTKEQTFKS